MLDGSRNRALAMPSAILGRTAVVVRSGTCHPAVICFTHRWLLASVSAIAMLAVASPADARPLGGGAATQSAATISAAQSAQIEAQRAAREASSALKRATLAVQAMQAAQKAARDAALAAPGGVPNGLVAGGLQVAPGAVPGSNLWQGAGRPTEFASGGRSDVSIEQTQQKAILTWQTFNVGSDTALYFDQRAGGADAKNWIALNRVLDPSAAPSRILGLHQGRGPSLHRQPQRHHLRRLEPGERRHAGGVLARALERSSSSPASIPA